MNPMQEENERDCKDLVDRSWALREVRASQLFRTMKLHIPWRCRLVLSSRGAETVDQLLCKEICGAHF